jgi:hypothetical protein
MGESGGLIREMGNTRTAPLSIEVRCPECGRLLFKAAPDSPINVTIKCKCHRYVLVDDARRPRVIDE